MIGDQSPFPSNGSTIGHQRKTEKHNKGEEAAPLGGGAQTPRRGLEGGGGGNESWVKTSNT